MRDSFLPDKVQVENFIFARSTCDCSALSNRRKRREFAPFRVKLSQQLLFWLLFQGLRVINLFSPSLSSLLTIFVIIISLSHKAASSGIQSCYHLSSILFTLDSISLHSIFPHL